MMDVGDRAVGSWNELLGTLLSDEDRKKIEWSIGCVLAGGPAKILSVVGEAGSGKSSILTLALRVFEECREEDSLKVSILHEGLVEGFSDDSFVFVSSLSPVLPPYFDEINPILETQTTGQKLSLNKFYLLAGFIGSSLGSIALKCLKTYRELGPTHYDTLRESSK